MAQFGKGRTDFNKVGKLQGVETPSQKRYLFQVDQLLKKQKLYLDSIAAVPDWAKKGKNCADTTLKYPPEKTINLGKLAMKDFFLEPSKVAKRGALVVVVKVNDIFVSQSEPVITEILSNKPVFELNIEVAGDVQVSIFYVEEMEQQTFGKKSEEGDVRCGTEKGILMTFFFHSAFVNETSMVVPIAMIDKACKNIDTNYDMEKANVELTFVKELERFHI